jgi:hypothetical protein
MAWRPFVTNLLGISGSVESGGLLYSYVLGTTTPRALYLDAGTTAATNPVVADSIGQLTIYADDTLNYSWTAKTANGATTLWQANVITGVFALTYVNPDYTVALAGFSAVRYVATYAALTALTTNAGLADNGIYCTYARTTEEDGGFGFWRYDSASTATANGGTILAINGSGAGRFFRLYEGIVSTKWFGAAGNNTNDDTAEIQAAIDACEATGGGTVYLSEGIYKISAALTADPGVRFKGDGATRTIIRQSDSSANGIVYSPVSLSNGGGGVEDLTIEAGVGWDAGGFQGTGSSGTGLYVKNMNDAFRCERFNINNFTTGIHDEHNWYAQFAQFQIFYHAGAGIYMPEAASVGAGTTYESGKITNVGFTGTNSSSIGIRERCGGGRFFRNLDVTSQNKGVVVDPPATYQVAYSFYDQVLADSTVSDAWTIDGTDGAVVALEAVGCWGAYSTNGDGLVTRGANLDGFQWTGGRLRENGAAGWDHQGGSNVDVGFTHIASNSQVSSLTYAGVEIGAAVSDWSLIGCRVGNYASSLGADQGNGVTIASGTSTRFRIALNDFNDQGSGKVAISNGSSADRNGYDILNNLPRGSVGNNRQRHILIPLVSTGAVAAGSTVYLGVGGSSATEGDVFHLLDEPGIIAEVYLENATAPGAAQTFTYTVRVNGADTAMTGTSSGASSFITTINTNQQSPARRDRVTVKVVASGGAASSFIRGTLRIEY